MPGMRKHGLVDGNMHGDHSGGLILRCDFNHHVSRMGNNLVQTQSVVKNILQIPKNNILAFFGELNCVFLVRT